MSAVDTLADKAQAASEKLARANGLTAKLAHELAEDATFLRKLNPALVAKRARGEAPTDRAPTSQVPTDNIPAAPKQAPSGPQPGEQRSTSGGGPSPFLVVGAALVVGILLAKWIDWRGHAHPRW